MNQEGLELITDNQDEDLEEGEEQKLNAQDNDSLEGQSMASHMR
jgi:hypothetical protein